METLFRTMAHRPNIMQAAMQLLEVVMRQGAVEPQLKELLAIRVSQVNHCSY
jgi:alkylhydroperoxidase family enzyme